MNSILLPPKCLPHCAVLLLVVLLLPGCMMLSPSLHTNSTVHNSGSEPRRDLVCGRTLDDTGILQYEFRGEIYYFERQACYNAFVDDPEHYIEAWDTDHSNTPSTQIYYTMGIIAMGGMMILLMMR